MAALLSKAMTIPSPRAARKKKPGTTDSAPLTIPPYVYYVMLGVVILSFALIRLRLRDMPLERDEGEYAYAGQLILQGIPPYQLAYNLKLPGTYASYAVILGLFGQTPAAVHVGLLLVNAATAFLVFLLAARLFGSLAGVVAGTSYAVLTASQAVLGFAGHATNFVVLPAVGGALLLLKAVESKRFLIFFLSGLLMGLAFVMKQPGVLFVFFSGLYILKSEAKPPVDYQGLAKRVGMFAGGAALPFALTCLWMWAAGVFHKFWFWTFSYASQYGTRLSFSEGMQVFSGSFPGVVAHSFFLWILAGIGLSALWWNPKARVHAVFASWFLLFSCLAVSLGLYFRQHYFIMMFPALAVLIGAGVSAAKDSLSKNAILRTVPVLLFLAACVYSIVDEHEYLFELSPIEATRRTYGINPFPEALKIADYIKSRSPEGAKVAVLGSEPEIYFYSHRHSATGYIYTYPLMEPQKYALTMQKEMESEIEAARPDFLVLVDVPFSWLVQAHSDTSIFAWSEKYIEDQYERVGMADLGDTTEYVWGDAAKSYHPQSKWTVSVFKRKLPSD
jgi:hypothetical protein